MTSTIFDAASANPTSAGMRPPWCPLHHRPVVTYTYRSRGPAAVEAVVGSVGIARLARRGKREAHVVRALRVDAGHGVRMGGTAVQVVMVVEVLHSVMILLLLSLELGRASHWDQGFLRVHHAELRLELWGWEVERTHGYEQAR